MTVTCSKPGTHTTRSASIPLTLVLLALACGTGCGPTPPQQTASAPAPEIRGEPIRPIEVATPVPQTNPATPTPPPAAAQDPTSPTTPAPPPAATATAAAPSTGPSAPAATGATAQAAATTNSLEHAPTGDGTADSPLIVGFDRLASFKYDVPDGPASTNNVETGTFTSQIPNNIRALDKQIVALKGFMLPLKVESGLVTEMLIMRDQSMCCFGTVPKINEWVSVKMSGKGVKPVMDQAVTLHGRLHVGEIRENGYLVGIYQMDGDRVIGPLDM